MAAAKNIIPDNISEEYYQISQEILVSFPKFRPPLDLFRFRENIGTLEPYFRKGQRLSSQQVEEVAAMCEEGVLFVSRSDHPIYSQHICKQLDLVLVDANLHEPEIADIFMQAFQLRLAAFFEQPVQPVFEQLYRDIMVLTEYLAADWHRIRALMRRLLTTHSLVAHSVNCGVVGLWLLLATKRGEVRRRELDRSAMAAFLHDMGMCKLPAFLLTKTLPLTQEERSKINAHPLAGLKMADKLGLAYDEMKQAISEHHERLDGSGYPRRIGENDMSGFGKLMAVCDSFCAMITERPYAHAMTPKDASKALAEDTNRYDARYSKLLQSLFASGDLGEKRPAAQPVTSGGAATASEASQGAPAE
ncbi:HD-GYP domain-containing protein [Megalodesulfovibrio paquesii]